MWWIGCNFKLIDELLWGVHSLKHALGTDETVKLQGPGGGMEMLPQGTVFIFLCDSPGCLLETGDSTVLVAGRVSL